MIDTEKLFAVVLVLVALNMIVLARSIGAERDRVDALEQKLKGLAA